MKTERERRKTSSITIFDQRQIPMRPFILAALIVLVGTLGFISVSCQVSPRFQTPNPSPSATTTSTATPLPPAPQTGSVSTEPTEEPVLTTPTLAPTATPSPLDFLVEDISEGSGLADVVILGLNGEDLANVVVSVLIVLIGSLLGILVINGLLWLADLTPAEFDARLLGSVESQLKWLIGLIFLQFATTRLVIINPILKQWLDLTYYSLYVLLIAAIIWKLFDYALEGPLLQVSSPENRNLLVTFTPLLSRSVQVLIFIISAAIILQKIGVNLSALLAVLGLGGLAISLAAKETLEDVINGFILLIDRPFQVGDRVKIESMDSWGDVEAIGARTSSIRTLDNRLVIIPNSVIGNSQVENYTKQDASMRIKVSLGIGYGEDIDRVIDVITGAVLSVPGLLKTRPPLVRLSEFGDSAIVFNVYYWLKSYRDLELKTTVNKVIYQALVAAEIEMPFVTYDVNLAYREPPGGPGQADSSDSSQDNEPGSAADSPASSI